MTEPKHFQKLQHQFFHDYAKKIEVQSSQVLFTCFHPVSQFKGDVVLMLEQQFYPVDQKVYDLIIDESNSKDNESFASSTLEEMEIPINNVHVSKKQKMNLKDVTPFDKTGNAQQKTTLDKETFQDHLQHSSSFGTSAQNDSINEKSQRAQFQEEIDNVDFLENEELNLYGNTKLSFDHHKLKFKPVEMQLAAAKGSKKRIEFRESIKNQIKRMQLLNHKQINQVNQVSKEDDDVPHQLLEKQRSLVKHETNIVNQKSIFSVQLWRLNQGKLPVMTTNMDITSESSFTIYLDQLYYSHDGNYIFFIVVNLNGMVEKIILLNSFDLSLPEQHEFDLRQYHIKAEDITDTPALIWGHKDSLNLDYMRQSTARIQQTEVYGHSYLQYGGNSCFYTPYGMSLQIPMQQDNKNKMQYQILGIFFENIKKKEAKVLANQPLLRKIKDPKKMTLIVRKNHISDPFNQSLKIYRIGFDQALQKIQIAGALTFTDEIKFSQQISHEDLGSQNLEIFASKDCKQILIVSENNPEENIIGNSGDSEQRKSLIFMTFQDQLPEDLNAREIFKGSSNIRSSFQNQQSPEKPIGFYDNQAQYSKPTSLWTYRDPAIAKNIHLKDDIRILIFNESQQSMVAVSTSDIISKSLEQNSKKNIEINSVNQIKVDGQIELSYINCFDLTSDQYGRLLTTGFDLVSDLLAKLYLVIYDGEDTLKYQLDFLTFVEFYSGSITINGHQIFRCQACLFLTIDENAKVRLNIIKMPVYQECKTALGDFNREKIKKCVLANVLLPNKQDVLVLIIQYENEILIRPLNSTQYHDQISTGGSKVPMISQNGQIKEAYGSVLMFVHTLDLANQHKINLLSLQPFELPKLIPLYDLKASGVLQMQRWDDFLMILDENLHVKRFKYSNRTGKMTMFRDAELSEESQTILSFYNQLPEHIVMSDSEVYIGPQFYQSYTNQNQMKDTNTIFEQYREKNIEKLDTNNLFIGPVLSQDDSMIMYLSVQSYNNDQEYQEPQTNDQDTHKKSLLKKNSLTFSKASARYQNKNKSMASSNKLKQSIRKSLTTESNQNRVQFLEDKEDGDDDDPLKFLEIEHIKLKEQQEIAQFRMKYEVLCIPYLGHKSVQLLHKDDYLMEQVKFSTFTMNDDIFLMINRQFYAFDSLGHPIKTIISSADQDLLKSPNLEMIRVQRLPCNGQSFLFTDNKKFYLFQLQYSNLCYIFKLAKDVQCLESMSAKDYFFEGKQDQVGKIYQVLIEPESEIINNGPCENLGQIRISVDAVECQHLSKCFQNLIFKQNNQYMSEAQIQQQFKDPEKSYTNIKETDEDRVDEYQIKSIIEDASMRFDFELLHEKYLVVKNLTDIYVCNLLSSDVNNQIMKVNLNLRPGVITQLLQTQKENMLQFVYTQYCPTKITFIFTWDLDSNMEESVIRFPLNIEKPQDIVVSKGVSERLNYYIPNKESSIYDLRYNFPLNYFDGISACLKWHMRHLDEQSRKQTFKNKKTSQFKIRTSKTRQLNELKFSSFNTKMLGISKQQYASLQLTYSYMDLQYIEFLLQSYETQKVKDDGNDIKYLLMRFLKFRLPNGNNILHMMATKESFLQMFQKDAEYQINDMDYKDAEQYYFLSIYPNNDGVSPLEIALNQHAPRAVELMLDMISSRPKYNYSKYLIKHFYKLLEMKSESFSKFLSICTFKIDRFFKCQWSYQRDERQFSNHTSYIEDQFLQDQFKVSKEYIADIYKEMLIDKNQTNSSIKASVLNFRNTKHLQGEENKNEGFEYEEIGDIFDASQEDEKNEAQNIIFTAIEFPWIFKGKSAMSFISYMTNVEENSNIFQIPTIQDIIIFQWRHFKKSYIKYKLIPFIFYFILILLYTTVDFGDELNENQQDSVSKSWERGHKIIGALILAFSLYFVLLEFFKLFKQNYNLTMLSDGIFYVSVIILVIIEFSGVSNTVFRILAVYVIVQNYQQLLMYLRVFDTTAVLISMIYYIIKDMLVFALIFIISIICFGNCFYIIQGLQEQSSEVPPLAGGNFIMVLLYTYSGALGNFDTGNFEQLNQNSWILWLLFFVSSFLLSIIFLNLLIAIMGDTYDSVMLIQKEERLRAKCRLINENEFIFNRDRLFANSRYIIVANIEKAINRGNEDWEGKMNALINTFNQKIEGEHEKTMENFKSLKQNNLGLSELIKSQDSKMNEIQGQLAKLSLQIKFMESKKRVKSIIKRSGDKIKSFLETQFIKSQQQKAQDESVNRETEVKNPLLKLINQKNEQNY
eukprot:403342303